jgi:membrane protein required for colicin V production
MAKVRYKTKMPLKKMFISLVLPKKPIFIQIFSMNTLDIILGVVLVFSFVIGFRKGFFVALASFIGLIAGIYGAVYFSDYAASYLTSYFDWSERTLQLAAFALTFLVILIVISLAGKILTKIADFAMLGILNKILGGAFNLLKFAFILSVILMFLNASTFNELVSEEQQEESVLYEPIASLAPIVMPHIWRSVEELENEQESTEAAYER